MDLIPDLTLGLIPDMILDLTPDWNMDLTLGFTHGSYARFHSSASRTYTEAY